MGPPLSARGLVGWVVLDDMRADYERLIAELRGLNAGLMVTVELLEARVAVLEKAAGQDSSNSSRAPSLDGVGPRKKRAERRAEARVAGRRPGKQPGSPGAHLRRRDPTSRSCMDRCVAVGVARGWRRRSWPGLRCVR